MARPSSIPEKLVIPLLNEWESGKNAQQLVTWLKDNHNVNSTVNAVNKRLKTIKDIQIQAKRDAIAKRASEQALDYVDMMDKKIVKLNKITEKLLDSDNEEKYQLAKQLLDTQLKFIDKQMDITGMDKPDITEAEDDVVMDGLLEKLPPN